MILIYANSLNRAALLLLALVRILAKVLRNP
nr:MAG TPA: hypothetical protein [Caudoviricetes sp.]